MNEKNILPDPEFGVVCVDCRSTQNAEKVMNSEWYKSGLTPPCQYCGGKTIEIAMSDYDQFVKDSKLGKFFG